MFPDFPDFVSPPQGSTHSQHVVRSRLESFEAVSQSNVPVSTSTFTCAADSLFNSADFLNVAAGFEYFRVKSCTLTASYVGGLLTPKLAQMVQYIEDPLHEPTPSDVSASVRPDCQFTLKVGHSHVIEVPVKPRWRYVKASSDPRMSSAGVIRTFCRPYSAIVGEVVNTGPMFEWTVDATIEFARRSVITSANVLSRFQPYLGENATPAPFCSMTDTRVVIVTYKTNQSVFVEENLTGNAFSQMPLDYLITFRDTETVTADTRSFTTSMTASSFRFAKDGGYNTLSFTTNAGSSIDFEQFYVSSLVVPKPTDFPIPVFLQFVALMNNDEPLAPSILADIIEQ